ncbi:MAG: C10 family peptidase, partial [Lachnospiraceae bacterium]|nr:C10 family peptidase [Lachnospiraceae bacterium]
AAAKGGAPKLVYTDIHEGQPSTYIFDKAGSAGYLVLSADDAAAPVLGYADEGTFDKDNIPDNMRYWLDMYAEEIAWARANGITYQAPSQAASYAAIAPLCKTKWNQDAPYNDLCPVATSDGENIKKGERAVTGCVATAMAQLMKYHNYPPVGEGSKTNSTQHFPSTTVNFANTPFDWNNMLDTYSANATEAQKQAVAQLMLACGVSVEMGYGTVASGTQSGYVANALLTYFKYDKAVKFIFRDYYSMTDWKEMAYNELKTVGPVLYSGSTVKQEGHCFIVDGYDGQDYFHLNWGWGGVSDGYFLLSSLDSDYQGIGGASSGGGFIKRQGMLLGAKKAQANSKRYYQMLAGDNPFVIQESSATVGSFIYVDMTSYNYTYGASVSGTLGLFVTSSSGNRQFVGQSSFSVNAPSGNSVWGTGKYAVKVPSLANGTYTVTPAWKSSDGTEYEIGVKVNLCRSYTMTVNGNNVTFKANNEAPQIQATKLQVTSKTLYAGAPGNYRVTFTNKSSNEYYGDVSVGLYRTTPTSGSRPTYTGSTFIVDVAPGETVEMPFSATFKNAAAGNYKLAFYNPNDNYKLLGSSFDVSFEAMPSDAETKLTVTDFGFIDGNTTNIVENNMGIQFTIECNEGYFNKPLYVLIVQTRNNVARNYFTISDVELFPGEKVTKQFYGSASSLPKAFNYALYLSTKSTYSAADILAGPVAFKLASQSGIGDVAADEEPAEVMYFNLQGIAVDFEQAAPGVYVRVSVFADGTSKSEKVRK